jgi:hypothetical protein
MKNTSNHCRKALTGGALVLALTATVYAQEKPVVTSTNAAPAPSFFTGKIPEAFTKGKFSLNARLRYEYADQDGGTPYAHAETIRTRFGYTTAPLYGFQGMIEAENVSAADTGTYANGPGSPVARDVIADGTGTEINQAWLGYKYGDTNWSVALKGGRQVITLDNHRFVGHVGWRQNMQSFDAAGVTLSPVKGLDLSYNYLWEVNRIFGNDTALAAGTSDFESDSHLFNAAYVISPLVKVVGYAYLLDLENVRGGSTINSCATYGGYLTGTWTFDKERKGTLTYRGEFAVQSDYADSTVSYDTEYYLADLKATLGRFNVGAGYEVLGSDGGQSFRTPLATLHAFNGWADVFLTTPAAGLTDLYVSAGVNLPGNIPLNFIYHKFDAETGGGDFGQEYDLVASKKIGKNWTLLAKYAVYDGKEAPAAFDKQVFWAELEFNF